MSELRETLRKPLGILVATTAILGSLAAYHATGANGNRHGSTIGCMDEDPGEGVAFKLTAASNTTDVLYGNHAEVESTKLIAGEEGATLNGKPLNKGEVIATFPAYNTPTSDGRVEIQGGGYQSTPGGRENFTVTQKIPVDSIQARGATIIWGNVTTAPVREGMFDDRTQTKVDLNCVPKTETPSIITDTVEKIPANPVTPTTPKTPEKTPTPPNIKSCINNPVGVVGKLSKRPGELIATLNISKDASFADMYGTRIRLSIPQGTSVVRGEGMTIRDGKATIIVGTLHKNGERKFVHIPITRNSAYKGGKFKMTANGSPAFSETDQRACVVEPARDETALPQKPKKQSGPPKVAGEYRAKGAPIIVVKTRDDGSKALNRVASRNLAQSA